MCLTYRLRLFICTLEKLKTTWYPKLIIIKFDNGRIKDQVITTPASPCTHLFNYHNVALFILDKNSIHTVCMICQGKNASLKSFLKFL